eukprot:m.1614341 g.1614341  ORF g.1614341 m.1614341 type:complete len:502 (+) comp25370_c0_seq18:1033-2538(+)
MTMSLHRRFVDIAWIVVSMLLISSLAPTAAVRCSDTVVESINAAVSRTQAACGTQDLSKLVPGDVEDYGDRTSNGDAMFCADACVEAVAALNNQAWPARDDCDLDDFGKTRNTHRALMHRQYECGPPAAACEELYTDYLFWMQTAVGQQCTADLQTARTAAAGGVDTAESVAAQYSSLCTGACGANMSAYLAALSNAACRSWPAYIAQKELYDLVCSAVDGAFCDLEIQHNTRKISDALNATNARVSQHEGIAGQICTPCFGEYIRMLTVNDRALRRTTTRDLAELCIAEQVDGARKFCLYEFQGRMANVSDRTAPDTAPLASVASSVCAVSLGRCAERVWAHRLSHWTVAPGSAVARNLTAFIKYSCLEIEPSNPKTCYSTASQLEAGRYTESGIGQTCTPTSIDGPCVNPALCRTWSDNSCPFQCSRRMNFHITLISCCIRSWRDFMEDVYNPNATNGINHSTYFDRFEFLSAQCCGDGTNGLCQNKIPSSCSLTARCR